MSSNIDKRPKMKRASQILIKCDGDLKMKTKIISAKRGITMSEFVREAMAKHCEKFERML